MSRTQNFEPVGNPILAAGHRDHHMWILLRSVAASWKPHPVSGAFDSRHGNTETPLFA
jgi:hypothetical protein